MFVLAEPRLRGRLGRDVHAVAVNRNIEVVIEIVRNRSSGDDANGAGVGAAGEAGAQRLSGGTASADTAQRHAAAVFRRDLPDEQPVARQFGRV